VFESLGGLWVNDERAETAFDVQAR